MPNQNRTRGRGETTRRTRGERVGGRSARVLQTVIDAAREELARVGFARLRVDDIAARAGVNKTTVYRRWPAKAELARSALEVEAAHGDRPVPDTGDLERDLVELLSEIVGRLERPRGSSLLRLLAAELADPSVGEIVRGLHEAEIARARQVFARARANGQLRPRVDTGLAATMLLNATFAQLRTQQTIPPATIRAMVRLVLDGVR